MTGMLEAFTQLIGAGHLTEIERVELPARAERRLPIPDSLRSRSAREWLAMGPGADGKIWRHQAIAFEALERGENVVLATGTASGKSLVFQLAALQYLEEHHESRIIVFYPLKALAADQLITWKSIISMAGFPEGTVARIDGDVPPDERDRVIENARIVAMTPDVCQAWLTRNVSRPLIRRFIGQLRMIILDEAHVLEAVFGSNVAFLLRRIQALRALILHDRRTPALRFIATSATIANPSNHLAALTGSEFTVVAEDDDGSPSHGRMLLHLAMNDDLADGMTQVLDLLLNQSQEGSFIAFADSRQGVERIATRLGHDNIRPYRSGYEAQDRQAIESALRKGELRGVVSTSALELGIDIPHFAVGLNVDVPASRKSFRQRAGRIGRAAPGAFAVIASPDAFHRLGSTFNDYWNGSVEPSHLYLSNRFMQFAHARCLAMEVEALTGSHPQLPAGVNWPPGFSEVFEYVQPGAARPREFDYVRDIGGDEPHYNYPLRNMAEAGFVITRGGEVSGGRIGTITLQQAIREAYPGAIYLHLAHGFKVYEWRNTAFDRTIRVGPWRGPANTRPLIRTFANVAVDNSGIVGGNFRTGTKGFLAECQMQVTERVEGIRQAGQSLLYRDLRSTDSRMTPKTRDFRTTGVIMRICEEWFRAPGEKARLAEALQELISREYSISQQDFAVASTNVSLVRSGGREPISDALVVYDATYGSLRLTEPVFTELPRLLDRLERAVHLVGDAGDPPVPQHVLDGLREWSESLESAMPPLTGGAVVSDGWLQVLAPESRVARRDVHGVLRDIVIVEPELIDLGDGLRLFYRYTDHGIETAAQAIAMVADSAIERVGDEWSDCLWCPTTKEIKQITE
jgi:DEAD/DEAH box helicase domain-containing protein